MSTKSVTLEDFIKNYKKKAEKTKSYAEWLIEQGEMPDFSDDINEAQKEYDRKRASYGKQGEALTRNGLLGSGYAAFLDANAYSELQDTKRKINEQRNLYDFQSRKGYANFLTNEQAKVNKLASQVLENIVNYKASDKDTAYLLALSSGLDEDTAKLVSSLGSSIADHKEGIMNSVQKRAILYQIVERGLKGDEAFTFARACGMNESDARKTVKAAEVAHFNNLGSLFSDEDEE